MTSHFGAKAITITDLNEFGIKPRVVGKELFSVVDYEKEELLN